MTRAWCAMTSCLTWRIRLVTWRFDMHQFDMYQFDMYQFDMYQLDMYQFDMYDMHQSRIHINTCKQARGCASPRLQPPRLQPPLRLPHIRMCDMTHSRCAMIIRGAPRPQTPPMRDTTY